MKDHNQVSPVLFLILVPQLFGQEEIASFDFWYFCLVQCVHDPKVQSGSTRFEQEVGHRKNVADLQRNVVSGQHVPYSRFVDNKDIYLGFARKVVWITGVRAHEILVKICHSIAIGVSQKVHVAFGERRKSFGLAISALAGWVLVGGIRRIGRVASQLVPAMVVLYLGSGLAILAMNLDEIPAMVSLILSDAFTGRAVAGGALWTVIVTGVRRAAFSNEAGIGSEALAHGAAKTNEPIREGLVAMLGPIIDTLLVCSCTALIILCTGTWTDTATSGATVTAAAFEQALPGLGTYILIVCVTFFSITTILTCGYYGEKSLGFLIGAERQGLYKYIYVAAITIGSMTSLTAVIDFIDGMYGIMAIPTMVSSLWLSPRVMEEARRYFGERQG